MGRIAARWYWLLILVLGVFAVSQSKASPPHYYTAEELASSWRGKYHPEERFRGDRFISSAEKGAFWLACGAVVASFANSQNGKVFHNHVIGAAPVRFDLDPDRPSWVRHGAFSDDVPQTMWGLASFTTGRDTLNPNELEPDATGLGVALIGPENHLVSWSATASKGAFASTGEGFARLSGIPALLQMYAGGMDFRTLAEAHALRQSGVDSSGSSNPYLRPPGIVRRGAMRLGRMVGEGIFVVQSPRVGLGTIVPAILTGRRSPFPGYGDTGFVTDNRLLTEFKPWNERRVFRVSFSLADTATNRRILSEMPGWLRTVSNNVRGTPGTEDGSVRLHRRQNLTAEFNRWIRQEGLSITYNVDLLMDPPVEAAHRGGFNLRVHVGRLNLYSFGNCPELGNALNDFAHRMHLAPGEGYHLPVGDLAWYRSVGRLAGGLREPATAADSVGQAGGAYPQSRELRQAPSSQAQIAELHQLLTQAGF